MLQKLKDFSKNLHTFSNIYFLSLNLRHRINIGIVTFFFCSCILLYFRNTGLILRAYVHFKRPSKTVVKLLRIYLSVLLAKTECVTFVPVEG